MLNINEANIGSAILQNYERAQEIYETSLNSEGSALAENEKYLQSVQGHLDKLSGSWESFSANLADSEGLKFFIDLGAKVINILDGMTSMFGSFGMVLLPVMGALSKFGNQGKFKYALLQQGNTSCRMLVA